jgi:competence protein ComEC
MQRPLLKVAVVYTAGILVGEFLRVPLSFLIAACVAALFACVAVPKTRFVCLPVLFLLLGWTNTIWRTAVISPSDLRTLIGDKPEIVTIRGHLDASPTERIFERHNEEAMRTVSYLTVDFLCRGTNWQPAAGKIIVTTPDLLGEDYFTGREVQVNGVLVKPSGPFADGLFDAKTFFKRKGIYYQLRVSSTNDWQTIGTATRPLCDRFFDYAKKTLTLGLPKDDLATRLIQTLVLDWKAPLTPDIQEPLVKAGTFHIFAVDGLRIGLITTMFVGLLQTLRVSRRFAGVLALAGIAFYVVLTGMPPSAIRAGIMAAVVICGWILKRPADALNSLFAAAIVILAWDPQQLFQPGFQLSFVVVLVIILIYERIHGWLAKPFAPDPFLPQQLVRQNLWHGGWIAHPRNFLIGTMAISIASWLGSIPLAANYFHVFNIVSTPANFVVVPLTALTLISCLGSLIVGAWLPSVAVLFNNASWLLMKCIIAISLWCVQWRPSAFNVSAPTLLTTITFYTILLALITGWIFRTKSKRLIIPALSLLAVACVVQWILPKPTMLHVLPLNGGQCILVDSGRPKTDLLIDSGDEQSVARITKPFLQAQGVNWFDSCCLSVAHISAMGGMEIVHTNFATDHLVTSATRNRSVAYKRVVASFDKQPEARRTIKAGDQLSGWNVLHPGIDDQFSRGDDNAVVLLRTFGKTSVLLLSTLGRTGQLALLERNPELRADIVITGLPANEEPLTPQLLESLQPKLIVIVDSEFPATRRASDELQARLATSKAQVIYCRETGGVSFAFSKSNNWKLIDANGTVLAHN